MKINKDNYEAYYLDYLEGTISSEDAQELLIFLQLHPELEIQDFEFISIHSNEEHFLPENIKQKITEIPLNSDEFKDLCIGEIEDILTIEEKQKLTDYLSLGNEYEEELTLFKKTKLIADKQLVFPTKEKLKKGKTRTLVPYISIAVAASLIGVIYLSIPTQTTEKKLYSKNSSKVKPTLIQDSVVNSTLPSIRTQRKNHENKTIEEIQVIQPINTIDYAKVNSENQPNQQIAFTNDSIKLENHIESQFEKNYVVAVNQIAQLQKNEKMFLFNETIENFNLIKNSITSIKISDEQKKEIAADLNKFHEILSSPVFKISENFNKLKDNFKSLLRNTMATK